MTGFNPVDLKIIDEQGKVLVSWSVPFTAEMTARQVLEYAFISAQTAEDPDPFTFTLAYYGYSENAQFPGYLGYEIESLEGRQNSSQYYWDLFINGVSSSVGADSARPGPGGKVEWRYTPVSTLSARSNVLQNRRTARDAG